MGLFSKKVKVDYDALFQEQYKSINQLMKQFHDEHDYMIKESILEVVVEKYNEIIECIDNGIMQDKSHFLSLQQTVKKDLELIKSINKDEHGH